MAKLTHVDDLGATHMVEIGEKSETARFARARAVVSLAPTTLEELRANRLAKGDALAVVRITAIQAAKATSNTIPLCHPIRLTSVDVVVLLHDEPARVEILATVHALDRTGPEMEAMAAATSGALALYDMCKSIDRAMTIHSVVLLEKSGGKSGHWHRDDA